MKKGKWNTIVFLVYLACCVVFTVLFWCVFDNRELYAQYFDMSFQGLLIACGVNMICQVVAMITKRKYAMAWMFLSWVLLLATTALTTAYGS